MALRLGAREMGRDNDAEEVLQVWSEQRRLRLSCWKSRGHENVAGRRAGSSEVRAEGRVRACARDAEKDGLIRGLKRV